MSVSFVSLWSVDSLSIKFTFLQAAVDFVLQLLVHQSRRAHSAVRLEAYRDLWRWHGDGDTFFRSPFVRLWLAVFIVRVGSDAISIQRAWIALGVGQPWGMEKRGKIRLRREIGNIRSTHSAALSRVCAATYCETSDLARRETID